MPTQRPDAAELVVAVREFLEAEVQPALEGSTAFHARVAVNVLKIVERELASGAALDAADAARLSAVLDREGTAAGLEAMLAARLADGTLGLDAPGVAAHLRASILGRVSVDNPRYESYRRAVAAQDD